MVAKVLSGQYRVARQGTAGESVWRREFDRSLRAARRQGNLLHRRATVINLHLLFSRVNSKWTRTLKVAPLRRELPAPLDRISQGTGLPRAGFSNLDVVITAGLRRNYRRQGREDFVTRMAQDGISAKRLEGGRHIVMLRRALIRDYVRAGVVPSADDAFNFSMWKGYLSEPYHSEPLEWRRSAGAEVAYLHTSGHASAIDLRAFANAVRPKYVVPVHGLKWDEESYGFGSVRRLADTECMVLD
jgi:hypothetical protein